MSELSARTHLYEHCTACDNGIANGPPDGQWRICRECGGSTHRLRSTHDPRSGIDGHDFETQHQPEAHEQRNETARAAAAREGVGEVEHRGAVQPEAGLAEATEAEALCDLRRSRGGDGEARPVADGRGLAAVGEATDSVQRQPRPQLRLTGSYGPSPFYALVPLAKRLVRMGELVRTLRSAENSAPLTELLDLVEGVARG